MTQVNISSFPLPNWQWGGNTAKLRLYASKDFLDSAGTQYMHGAIGSQNGFFQEIVLAVSGSDVTAPASIWPATLDSLDQPTVTITGVLFDSLGAQREVLFSGWAIPNLTPTTFAALRMFNRRKSLDVLRDTFLTTQDTLNLISQLVQAEFREIFTGNGTTAAFTIARDPVTDSDRVVSGNVVFTPAASGVNTYVRSGRTFTLDTPPQLGDFVVITYKINNGLVANGQIPNQIQEGGGPSVLTLGTISDGQTLRRSGSSISGWSVRHGVVTLVDGVAAVSLASVTANSRIQLTGQDDEVSGALRVSIKTPGNGFIISSNNGLDSGVVHYVIYEP